MGNKQSTNNGDGHVAKGYVLTCITVYGTSLAGKGCTIFVVALAIACAIQNLWKISVHKPVAYVLDTSKTSATDKFKTNLQAEMKERGVLVTDTSLNFENIKQTKLDHPLILVCNNCSRIVTDIESSLVMIKDNMCSKIIFVVLHVARKETQPAIYTRDLQPALDCFKKMDIDSLIIIDMAYSKDVGIYDCEMNSRAFKELTELLSCN